MVLDDMPLNATGKVNRVALKRVAEARLAAPCSVIAERHGFFRRALQLLGHDYSRPLDRVQRATCHGQAWRRPPAELTRGHARV